MNENLTELFDEYIYIVKKIYVLSRKDFGGDGEKYEQLESMKKYKDIMRRRLERAGVWL